MSEDLQSRMQGKSCFNFRKVEPNLFKKLGKLAKWVTTDSGRLGWHSRSSIRSLSARAEWKAQIQFEQNAPV
jgi:hypothetical protein